MLNDTLPFVIDMKHAAALEWKCQHLRSLRCFKIFGDNATKRKCQNRFKKWIENLGINKQQCILTSVIFFVPILCKPLGAGCCLFTCVSCHIIYYQLHSVNWCNTVTNRAMLRSTLLKWNLLPSLNVQRNAA